MNNDINCFLFSFLRRIGLKAMVGVRDFSEIASKPSGYRSVVSFNVSSVSTCCKITCATIVCVLWK